MTADFKDFVNAWLLKANHDVITAQRLLDIEPMILDNACFHCQQAVEKSLKAFLAYSGKDILKTHDIYFLLSECAKIDNIFSTIDVLNINDFAVQARYPDSSIMPEINEARFFYELAIQVNALVKEKIVFT